MKRLWKVVHIVRKTWVLVAKDKSNTEGSIVPRCFLSWRAVPVRGTHPQSGEIIGILKQLMAAQKEDEDRMANHAGLVAAKEEIATVTATIETKLSRQGDVAVEVLSLKNDVGTQRSLAADQELAAKLAESCSGQSSEWEERQKSRAGEGAPCESRTSRKTHALFTSVNLGMRLVACIRDVLGQVVM